MTAAAILLQAAIAALGLTAIWCMGSPKARVRRVGAVFGLLSQPLWLTTTYQAEQWGMLLLSFAYTIAWIRAIRAPIVEHAVDPRTGKCAAEATLARLEALLNPFDVRDFDVERAVEQLRKRQAVRLHVAGSAK